MLGTLTARVGDPGGIGRVDEATLAGSTLRLRGWAFDEKRPSDEIAVGIVVDGGAVTRYPTGLARPDVDSAYGITGDHGFDVSVTLASGRHLITVFAMASSGAALIRTEEVTVS